MAWALQFDGVNDYASAANWTPTGANYSVEVEFSTTQNSAAWSGLFTVESYNDNQGFGLMIRGGSLALHILDEAGNKNPVTITGTSSASDGGLHIAKVVVSPIETKVYLDGDLKHTDSRVPVLSSHPIVFGARNGNSGSGATDYLDAQIKSWLFIDDSDALNNRNYDAASSSHAAGTPVLTDTIGGNNATGVNMPTDGSAWIDLGGSGGLTASITESGPSFTEQISATLSKAIEASITELGPSFTESISTNLSANIAGSIGESGPAFTESISATLSTLTIQGNITESGPSFTDSISVDVQASVGLNASIAELGPSFTESVQASLDKAIEANISEYGPSFTDSIAISLTSEIDASIGEYGPSFIESLSAKIPVKISVNAKNTIKVKRSANTVKIKRKSNILRVK